LEEEEEAEKVVDVDAESTHNRVWI